MAERVEILVVATDTASQVLRGVTGSFGALGNAIQGITGGRALEYLTSSIIDFGKESVKTFTEGAMAAKELSRASGTTIEDASRFIEVLDDFGLKQQDALTATRALTKEGLAPNIDTLARLSDQYIKILDPQERNEFILKNLGRAGLQWAQVLGQGSEALLEHADAIDTNLIYTEKMYQEAEKLRIAQDTMNEAWQKISITVGNELVPVLTDGMDAFNNTTRAIEIMREKGLNPTLEMLVNSDGYIAALRQADEETENQREAMMRNTEAAGDMTIAHEKSKEQLEEEERAAKALTEKYQTILGIAKELYSNQQGYEKDIKDLQEERIKIEKEMAESSVDGSEKSERAAEKYHQKLADINRKIDEANEKGKETDRLLEDRRRLQEDYAYAVSQGQENANEKAQDYIDKLTDIDGKIAETKQKHHEAMNQMAYDLLVTKLSADKLTTAEFDIAIQAGLTFGIFDQETADAATAMNGLTDKVAAGKISAWEFGQIMDGAMDGGILDAAELQRKLAELPTNKTIYVDVVSNYITQTYSSLAGQGGLGSPFAGGGDVTVGMLHRVNETSQEFFQPSMSGEVIPLGTGNKVGNGQGMTFVYSPQMSLGSQREAETIIMPFIEQAVRRMQSDGRVAL